MEELRSRESRAEAREGWGLSRQASNLSNWASNLSNWASILVWPVSFLLAFWTALLVICFDISKGGEGSWKRHYEGEVFAGVVSWWRAWTPSTTEWLPRAMVNTRALVGWSAPIPLPLVYIRVWHRNWSLVHFPSFRTTFFAGSPSQKHFLLMDKIVSHKLHCIIWSILRLSVAFLPNRQWTCALFTATPNICQFWYTTASFGLVKENQEYRKFTTK